MTIPAYARLAARLLAKASEPVIVPPPSSASRADAIAALEAALVRRGQAKRRKQVAVASLGVAAAVALFSTGPMLASKAKPSAARGTRALAGSTLRPPVVAHPFGEGARLAGGSALAADGTALAPGARVVAMPRGRALLAFASGTRVHLEEGGEVTMLEAGASQVIGLGTGALRADVAKLAQGERFVVRTGDAEIEVHGTSFRVANVAPDPACGAGTTTRVDVYEGVVAVRRAGLEDRLHAGEHWPRDCTRSAPDAEPLAAGRPPERASAQPPKPAPAPVPAFAASELRAQNDAFAAATAARRAGEIGTAIARLESLLARYPRGPLSEAAYAERMRLLAQVDTSRAGIAARDYIARFPSGFARKDAEALLGGAR